MDHLSGPAPRAGDNSPTYNADGEGGGGSGTRGSRGPSPDQRQGGRGRHEINLDTILPAAEEGDPRAQHTLGICYNSGISVERDPVTAFQWFRRAADQGYPKAEHDVGICYFTGEYSLHHSFSHS